MIIRCIWEFNVSGTLLHAADFPGAFARGADIDAALYKMPAEIAAYTAWRDGVALNADGMMTEVVQRKYSALNIADADSDIIFDNERMPMTEEEYASLKRLALRSAEDFNKLYLAIPDKKVSVASARKTFYGHIPRNAEEMYIHTKNINSYYFDQIGVGVDNTGDILSCRERGFMALEETYTQNMLLKNRARLGSYDEEWSVKKLLRKFIWHDRIHAKAMYRMANSAFGSGAVPNLFKFEG